ncbi:MAG: thiamine pyrophosphate-binding protein [Anaerolineales bacterium]|nr:thiamine pyrophosphate-binding protein [Anaerolineales bacterium]
MQKSPMTGAEIIAEMLVREGMRFVIGVPGHGNLPLVDAFRRRRDEIAVIMPRHEQAAVHMADGYFRVTGKPLAVYTSIGAGAANTAIGLATAYVDSIPLLLLIGETHTHMRGVGVLQEIDRQYWSDLPRSFDPVVKRSWRIDQARQLPRAVSQAFNAMLTGRPGPVFITLPMDVQAQSVDIATLPDPLTRRPRGAPGGDPGAIQQAAALLVAAQRPVILVGGGVVLSRAEAEVKRLAEHLGAAVVTTMQGKGAFPEDHPLYGWHMGSNGTTCGNHLTNNADVILAVGVRFADKAASSYRPGHAFNIPPTKLIHVDIDPFEIGKNYPAEIGIEGDARAVMRDLASAVESATAPRTWVGSPYATEIKEQVQVWLASFQTLRESEQSPPTMARVIADVRRVLPPDGVVFTSSGNIQAQVFQEMAFTLPRTYLSAGGFSTMGWSYPAALGAKLALPHTPVVALVGDGDFLMTIQEIATAVQYEIPVVAVVFNNQGWQAIRDLQRLAFGEEADYATMFEQDDRPITPHLADIAAAFGAYARRVTATQDVAGALEEAIASGRPAVIEVMIDTQLGASGGQAPGWWDVPVPGYLVERRRDYEREAAEEVI